MSQETFWLTASDDCKLFVRSWGAEMKKPEAVIIISHGMTEHTGRYGHLASFFKKLGFIVYADDHRGHGKTGEAQGQLGYIAETDGFDLMVEDLHLLVTFIKKAHPGLPVIIFGHSMGSFITRNYIQRFSQEVTAVILSGSGFFPERTTKLGLEIAMGQSPRKESALMNKLVFGNYNKRLRERFTPFDWLSRDKQVVKAYMEDPLSGYVPTAGFFVDLLTGILSMQDEEENKQIRKDLPILFISGDADPVGNYSKGVFQAAANYSNIGLENVLVALFPEARHELHNEINKEEVFEFLNRWIFKLLHHLRGE